MKKTQEQNDLPTSCEADPIKSIPPPPHDIEPVVSHHTVKLSSVQLSCRGDEEVDRELRRKIRYS